MQAVEVLQNLGNSISQQLDLGNSSSVTFEKVTEDLGKKYILKTVQVLFQELKSAPNNNITITMNSSSLSEQLCMCLVTK